MEPGLLPARTSDWDSDLVARIASIAPGHSNKFISEVVDLAQFGDYFADYFGLAAPNMFGYLKATDTLSLDLSLSRRASTISTLFPQRRLRTTWSTLRSSRTQL